MSFFSQYDALLTPAERNLVDRARAFCTGAFSRAVHDAQTAHSLKALGFQAIVAGCRGVVHDSTLASLRV